MTKRASPRAKAKKARDAKGEVSPILTAVPDFEALFPIRRCLDDQGAASDAPDLGADVLARIVEYMILNRELDERLTTLHRQGRIGFHIGSVGEEATMIGSAAALLPDDWAVPCYREMGVALYRGMSLDAVLANMFGTRDDPVKGRQMPCHYADRAHNFLSISSPVGTQIPHAAGIGWAMRLEKAKSASAVYFGDGATSEGDFHTGLNFAGVYNSQTVFICRNNGWAISTPMSAQTASRTIAQKAIAYGIAAERVDGNDVLAVYAATSEALARARSGQGPTLLEMLTYRIGAHSTSDDPRAYRTEAEVARWKALDPIARFCGYLRRQGLFDDAQERALREKISREIQAAIERAEKVPPPAIETMFGDVFAEVPSHLAWQRDELLRSPSP